MEKQETGLLVTREEFTPTTGKAASENRTLSNYFIETPIRGKKVRIKMSGSYHDGRKDTEANVFQALEIAFDKAKTLPLVVQEGSMEQKDGSVVKFRTYSVFAKENGVEYSSPIYPYDKNAKILLDNKFAELGIKVDLKETVVEASNKKADDLPF